MSPANATLPQKKVPMGLASPAVPEAVGRTMLRNKGSRACSSTFQGPVYREPRGAVAPLSWGTRGMEDRVRQGRGWLKETCPNYCVVADACPQVPCAGALCRRLSGDPC